MLILGGVRWHYFAAIFVTSMTMMMKREIQAWALSLVHNQKIFLMAGFARYAARTRLISILSKKNQILISFQRQRCLDQVIKEKIYIPGRQFWICDDQTNNKILV